MAAASYPLVLERLVPDHAQRRADGLDAAAVRDLDVRAGQAGLPAHLRRRWTSARRRSRSRSTPPSGRAEADALLAEYRERLKEAREQADEIIEPARKAAETHERDASEEAKAKREQMMEQTRRDIESETRRAIQEIRREVADLTVMATEKVTRKTLTDEDQRRLVEDALSELDFSALSAAEGAELVEEIAQVYARALFEVAVEQDALDEIHDQLGAFADAMHENRDLAMFFFSPYFSVTEKKDGLEKAVTDANPIIHELPGGADRAPPDAGHLPDPRREFEALWDEERRLLPVQPDQRGRA